MLLSRLLVRTVQTSRLVVVRPWYRRFWPLTIACTVATTTSLPIGYFIYRNFFHQPLTNDETTESVSQSELDQLLSETEQILNDELYSTRSSRIFTPIRLVFRTIKLIIIFTPVLIFYILQDRFAPNLYETWCFYLKRTFAFCGPCFIKLGQWMATRPDLFTREFCQIFNELHSNAPTHSLVATKQLLKDNNIVIDSWSPETLSTPLASGAIAQIYRCRINNMDLVMKIRHPNVQNQIFYDLKLFHLTTRILTKFLSRKITQHLNLEDNIRSFTKNMLLQTNLVVESKNLKIFEKNFQNYKSRIRFPQVDPCLPTTKDVLFQTYEQGLSMNEFLDQCQDVHVRKQLAHLGINAYLKMVFVDNFVHADLHPGNMLVRLRSDKSNEPSLVFLDVGLTSSLTPNDKKNFYDLFRAIANYDANQAASLMIERAPNANSIDEQSKIGFQRDMSTLIDRVIRTPLKQVEVGRVLSHVLELGRQYNIQVDPNFTTIALGTIIIEGIGRQLDPDLDFVSAARPYLQHDFQLVKAYLSGIFFKTFLTE